MSTFRVNWKCDDITRKMRGAQVKGIDDTMAAATIDAKQNHPGWRNRTGTAEGSVRAIDTAHVDRKGAVGRWGSQGVNYVIWLELMRGSFLRNAASIPYPTLGERIRQHFRGLV